MSDDKELIWVEKEFAEKYKAVESDANKNKERVKALNDYLATVSTKTRASFKGDLETLEEDAAIYKGLMLSVRQAFEKAKNEHMDATYKIWEDSEKELPSTEKKVAQFINKLKPLIVTLKEAESIIKSINTFQIDDFVKSVESFNRLHDNHKEMLGFLIENFKSK